MYNTKKMTTISLLCTIAYVVMLTKNLFPALFPSASFLQYDPKDVVVVIGGFIYGPLASFVISLIVSFIEMITVSDTNIIGCIMNVASTCAFACTAAAIYSRRRTVAGGVIGLIVGSICATATMLVLNYWVTPLYMHLDRKVISENLLPVFLPFNLIKSVLNSAIVLLIYKPTTRVLRRTGLLNTGKQYSSRRGNIAVLLAATFMLVICAVALIILNN